MKVNFKLLYIEIFIFLFLYSIPIIQINTIHLLFIIAILDLLFLKNKKTSKIILSRKIFVSIFLLSISIFYLLLIVLIKQTSILMVYEYIIILIEVITCSIYIILYIKEIGKDFFSFIDILLIIGNIQALIAIIAFLNKDVQLFFGDLIANGVYEGEKYRELMGYRIYGYSSSLLYATPLVQTILSNISIFLGIHKNNKRYFLLAPLMMFSAIINARTSIVLFSGCFILVIIIYICKKKLKKLFKIAIYSILIILVVSGYMKVSNIDLSTETFIWIQEAISSITAFFQGKKEGYFTIIGTSFTELPKGTSLLFGTGRHVFGVSSDIGYVNDIWLGGICFILFIYGAFYQLIKTLTYKTPIEVKCIGYILIAGLIIANIKGIVIGNNDLIRLTMMICMAMGVKIKDD